MADDACHSVTVRVSEKLLFLRYGGRVASHLSSQGDAGAPHSLSSWQFELFTHRQMHHSLAACPRGQSHQSSR